MYLEDVYCMLDIALDSKFINTFNEYMSCHLGLLINEGMGSEVQFRFYTYGRKQLWTTLLNITNKLFFNFFFPSSTYILQLQSKYKLVL